MKHRAHGREADANLHESKKATSRPKMNVESSTRQFGICTRKIINTLNRGKEILKREREREPSQI